MSTTSVPENADGPARPEKLTVDFYDEPDGVAVHKKKGGGPAAFLLLWLTGWTVGCVVLFFAVLREPTIGMFAFAVPFWASWLFVAALLVWMLFGKETLLVRQDKALFQRTALIQLSSRAVPRKEVLGFRECRSHHTENDEYLWGIEMVTLGKPIRFAFRLPDREREWLIYQLNRYLGVQGPEPEDVVDSVASKEAVDSSLLPGIASEAPATSETLTYEQTLLEPPTDCDWEIVEDFNAFTAEQRGKLSLGALATLLFINLFWNGIVSVFVMLLWGVIPNGPGLRGWEWWGLFVFLIPFEAIGLAMLVGLLFTALDPFRRTQWHFEHSRVIKQIRWPFYVHSRRWEFEGLKRVELRDGSDRRNQSIRVGDAAASPFELAFVSLHNTDLFSIRDLTEGEARWLARVIMDRRPHWFHS